MFHEALCRFEGRLLTGLLLGLIGLYVAAGLTMFVSARALLQRQFDATLAAKAQALASLIRLTPGGRVTIEPLETLPAWNGASGGDLRGLGRGRIALLRSPALEKNDLPSVDLPGTDSPGGRSPELCALPAPCCRAELRDASSLSGFRPLRTMKTSTTRRRRPRIARHRLRRPSWSPLCRIRENSTDSWTLWASVLITVVASAGTVAVVQVVVRRGLRPLQDVAVRAAQIDVQSLHIRFPIEGLPAESRPICLRLNASLEKLQQAFQRTAVSRRTPPTICTPIAEAGGRWPMLLFMAVPSAAALLGPAADYFQDARDIALQMDDIVRRFPVLARCHAGAMNIVREPVDVSAMLMDGWRLNQLTAGARRVDARFEMPPQATVFTDRTMLGAGLGISSAMRPNMGSPAAPSFARQKWRARN